MNYEVNMKCEMLWHQVQTTLNREHLYRTEIPFKIQTRIIPISLFIIFSPRLSSRFYLSHLIFYLHTHTNLSLGLFLSWRWIESHSFFGIRIALHLSSPHLNFTWLPTDTTETEKNANFHKARFSVVVSLIISSFLVRNAPHIIMSPLKAPRVAAPLPLCYILYFLRIVSSIEHVRAK